MNLYLVVFTFFLMYLCIASSGERTSKSSDRNESAILKKTFPQIKAKVQLNEKGSTKVSKFSAFSAKKRRLRKKTAAARKRRTKVLRPVRIVQKDLNNKKLENEVIIQEIADVKKTEKPGSTKVGKISAQPAMKNGLRKTRKRRQKVLKPIRKVRKDQNNTKLENEVIKKQTANVKQKGIPGKDAKKNRLKKIRRPGKVLKPIRKVQKDRNDTRHENEGIKIEKTNSKRKEPSQNDKLKEYEATLAKLDSVDQIQKELQKLGREYTIGYNDNQSYKKLDMLEKRQKEILKKTGFVKTPRTRTIIVEPFWAFCKPFSRRFCRRREKTKCIKKHKNGECMIEKRDYVATNIESKRNIGYFKPIYFYFDENGRTPHELDTAELQAILGQQRNKTVTAKPRRTTKPLRLPKNIQQYWKNYKKEKCKQVAPGICKVVMQRTCIKRTAQGCVEAEYRYAIIDYATNESKDLPPVTKTVDPESFIEPYGF